MENSDERAVPIGRGTFGSTARGFFGANTTFPSVGRGRGISTRFGPQPSLPGSNFPRPAVDSPISAASFGELRKITEKLEAISGQLAEVLQVIRPVESETVEPTSE